MKMAKLFCCLGTWRYRRYIVLTAWVVFAVAMAVIYVRYGGIKPYINHYPSEMNFGPIPKNEINGFTCYRYDPNTNNLCFAASIGSLRAENAAFGIFRTTAAKSVKVNDLRLHFDESSASSVGAFFQSNALPERPAGSNKGLKEVISQLANVRDYSDANVDLSNACEITIDNFDCRMFGNGDLHLAVQSRRAIVDSDWPQVTLRGRVAITTGDGNTLMSNHVKWNVQKQTFTAEGTYFLQRGRMQLAGKGISLDRDLNIVDAKKPGNKKGEGKNVEKCFSLYR